MSIEATYHSEVRFVRSAHSSKTGTTITLALPDSDELSKVAGFDGKRYMLALVEIGDDEQPVQVSPKTGYTPATTGDTPKPKGGYASKWLAMRCAEPTFREFLIDANPFMWKAVGSEGVAADLVRKWCGVKSRAAVDSIPRAKEIFDNEIRIPYMKWLATHGHTAPEVEHA